MRKKFHIKYINIILEEIELYFHPEYQRTYINDLIEGIKKLNLENIESINLIFVTHSPFILSDIPSSNIMYLRINEGGYSENSVGYKKSFSANIHHLLEDNFFFEKNIYIGEFSYKKIKEIINFIKDKSNEKNKKKAEYYYNLIELIDEPVLKNKLREMLYEKYPSFCEDKNIEKNEMKVKTYAEQMGVEISIIKKDK